jgi:hypothetical protein
MKLKYEKTSLDRAREISDIRRSPIMRFLKHQDYFKFNLGDILVKQKRYGSADEWQTEVTAGVKTPKKFMYVFENELGIGYLKQLRVDGTGFTTELICTANFDPNYVRFVLDPDFVDHMLIGDSEFEYNKEYVDKKAFRDEAVKKNTKILVGTRSLKKRIAWLANLKYGDMFWMGETFDELVQNKFKVIMPTGDEHPLTITVEVLEHKNMSAGTTKTYDEDYFTHRHVTSVQPFPMGDPLCDRPR